MSTHLPASFQERTRERILNNKYYTSVAMKLEFFRREFLKIRSKIKLVTNDSHLKPTATKTVTMKVSELSLYTQLYCSSH